MKFEQIKDLIELVADRDLGRVEIERSGFRLAIEATREVATVTAAPHPTPVVVAEAAVPVVETAAASAAVAADATSQGASSESADKEDELPPGTHVMTSPIVGTFYQSPNPEAAPFVDVSDQVAQGEVLCIVEAMKLMNEIEADVGGTILKIYPQNGQPVEYGEPLFAIKPR